MYILGALALVIITAFVLRYFNGTKKDYRDNTVSGYKKVNGQQERIVTENDLIGLPAAVQKYLNYVGVIGKEMPDQFSLEINGEMRFDKTKDWAPVTADQTTFLDTDTRLFYIVMKMFGMPINGLHHYEAGKASMVIKILDLFKIIDNRGDEMNIAETVTYFNDMCLFAPAGLTDADIEWEEINDSTVLARYTNSGITISATLYFNEKGELINFISDDRYAVDAKGNTLKVKWSTPIHEYAEFNGYKLISSGEAVWHYEDGDFCYIKMNIVDHSYN